MTVGSDVKQCFASLRGVEASLSSLALRTLDDESKRTLHEAMMVVHEVTKDLKKKSRRTRRRGTSVQRFLEKLYLQEV